jgi:hypothetical protein
VTRVRGQPGRWLSHISQGGPRLSVGTFGPSSRAICGYLLMLTYLLTRTGHHVACGPRGRASAFANLIKPSVLQPR